MGSKATCANRLVRTSEGWSFTSHHIGGTMMKSLRTRLITLGAAAALAMTAPVITAGAANATDNMPGTPPSYCAGTPVEDFPRTFKTGAGSFTVYVTYSPVNGGTNCAIVKKSGAWLYKPTWMKLIISRADTEHLNRYPYVAWEEGAFTQYVGAVSIPNTNRKCINLFFAASQYATQYPYVYFGRRNQACG